MLSEVFWTFFITSLAGFLLKCASMAYKSKCKEVDICCIKIIRDVELEDRCAGVRGVWSLLILLYIY
jgi:hypothetical protein